MGTLGLKQQGACKTETQALACVSCCSCCCWPPPMPAAVHGNQWHHVWGPSCVNDCRAKPHFDTDGTDGLLGSAKSQRALA